MDRQEVFTAKSVDNEPILGFDTEEMVLPFEVLDPEDVTETINRLKVVPYAGDTQASGDGLLSFYNKMANYGSTSNACIEAKKIVGFGNKAKVVKRTDQNFDIMDEDEEDVPPDIAKKYVEFVNKINWGYGLGFMDAAINNYVEWESNGNMIIELQLYEVGTERFSKIITHQQSHFRYLFTKTGEPKSMLYSIKWDNDYVTKNPPEEIPLYPNATRTKGVIRTLFHVKNGNFWYGRPPSKGSLLYQYNEYQNTFYLCRLTGKEFTGKVIIEVEDDAPQSNRFINNQRDKAAGYKGTLDRFERKFTQKSKSPSTVILTTRPAGAKPMTVEQIMPNTNERYYQKMDEINSGHIIKSHSWSPRLLGGNTSSYFSTNVYIDELKVKDATSNLYNQNMVHRILSMAIKESMIWMNETKLMDYSFNFISPYLKLIENEKRVNAILGVDTAPADSK